LPPGKTPWPNQDRRGRTRAAATRYRVRVAFRGWPAEALEFYEGLEADNSKTYWTAHKDVYERHVRGPMLALLAELEPEFGAGKLFRPYRDVRFSPDKSPYKTVMGASLAGGGYVQLSARGLGAASGMYVMAPDQLERYRRAVADDRTGERLAAIVAEVERRHGGEVAGHDRLRTAPRGYPRDHPRIALLRQKGIVVWKQWPVEPWLGTGAAKRRVVDFLRTARPLHEWLATHVGPSTVTESR
jgi:uncharacterized protein (TIGR02453 family)